MPKSLLAEKKLSMFLVARLYHCLPPRQHLRSYYHWDKMPYPVKDHWVESQDGSFGDTYYWGLLWTTEDFAQTNRHCHETLTNCSD